MNVSCYTYVPVSPHIRIRQLTHINGSRYAIPALNASLCFFNGQSHTNASESYNYKYSIPHTRFRICQWVIIQFRMCGMTHSYMRHVTWRIHTCDVTHSYVWHVTWLIDMCDTTHSYVWGRVPHISCHIHERVLSCMNESCLAKTDTYHEQISYMNDSCHI